MKVAEVQKFELSKNPHNVETRIIYDTEKAMMVHILLKPGESLKRHITPVDVAFYVLEGHGIVEIGDEKREVGPDTIIESPARIPHRWINETDKNIRILVIKLPKPKDKTVVL
ncbi:MAG TPA: cupin domain-containing protein [Methanocella sp.]|nr:cupin domain-containing protein [Methanocella sp.]